MASDAVWDAVGFVLMGVVSMLVELAVRTDWLSGETGTAIKSVVGALALADWI